jgi:hypothetical protein
MTPRDAIRAAMPDATDELCDFIVWSRTPYPFTPLTARDFYRAASRWGRATAKGVALCECCDRAMASEEEWLCAGCRGALDGKNDLA